MSVFFIHVSSEVEEVYGSLFIIKPGSVVEEAPSMIKQLDIEVVFAHYSSHLPFLKGFDQLQLTLPMFCLLHAVPHSLLMQLLKSSNASLGVPDTTLLYLIWVRLRF
mmetsp:Transcript_28662/g.50996  ORF Transcript_28662/g.50996 Transcript_28662/m.50996 type:complete len:107 (-) Transcript_28662:1244-1564(-)